MFQGTRKQLDYNWVSTATPSTLPYATRTPSQVSAICNRVPGQARERLHVKSTAGNSHRTLSSKHSLAWHGLHLVCSYSVSCTNTSCRWVGQHSCQLEIVHLVWQALLHGHTAVMDVHHLICTSIANVPLKQPNTLNTEVQQHCLTYIHT